MFSLFSFTLAATRRWSGGRNIPGLDFSFLVRADTMTSICLGFSPRVAKGPAFSSPVGIPGVFVLSLSSLTFLEREARSSRENESGMANDAPAPNKALLKVSNIDDIGRVMCR